MKHLIIFAISALLLTSCQQKMKTVTNSVPDMHTSEIALDWEGRYEGLLPCADCDGILTVLQINKPGNYWLKTSYTGKESNQFEMSGKFTWINNGSGIELLGVTNGPNKFLVGENQLIQLDMKGERIQGDLADHYILKRKISNASLEDTQWTLMMLYGKEIERTESFKDAFIFFDSKKQRAHGNAGCNRFFGNYELLEGNRIKLHAAAATMMACPDMETEQQFFKILELADNYTIADGKLSLNKARMAPLAVFIATEPAE